MSDAAVHGLAGAGGGIVAQLLTYPLQAVNTRQQTERENKEKTTEGSISRRPADAALGTVQRILKVIHEEGWNGLYRGLSPSLVGTAASQGVYYYFYQMLRDAAEARRAKGVKLKTGSGSIGTLDALVIAAAAGCINVLLTNPIWVVVTRMQTASQVKKLQSQPLPARAQYRGTVAEIVEEGEPVQLKIKGKPAAKGTLGTILELYREAGVLGFWKGVVPTLVMVSNPSIQFMVYETLRSQLISKRPATKAGVKYVSASETFIIGAIAKLIATVTTYPLLVIKARLQAKQEIGATKEQRYTGSIDAIGKMLRLEGLGAFYRGLHLKIFQSVLASAVLFMIKEELVKVARLALQERQKIKKVLMLKGVP